jgi:hypothetical protein
MLEVTISVNDGPRTVSVVCRVPLKDDEFPTVAIGTSNATQCFHHWATNLAGTRCLKCGEPLNGGLGGEPCR